MNDIIKTNQVETEAKRVEGSNTVIDFYATKCNCGAITIDTVVGSDNKNSCSMTQESFDRLCKGKYSFEWMNECYCCNHCVNHWGVDLCECGSGDPVGECEWEDCNFHNGETMQYFEDMFSNEPNLHTVYVEFLP